jgi:hypothetical protein
LQSETHNGSPSNEARANLYHKTAGAPAEKCASRDPNDLAYPVINYLPRTLDALHLVSALEVQQQEGLNYFVSADVNLCQIAQEEHLSVINPAP